MITNEICTDMEDAARNKELFEKISSFLKNEGATKVAVFGSYAGERKRGEVISTFWWSFPKQKVC